MTARRTILSRFRRRPRPTDPEPYSRLDRLDGLPRRDYGEGYDIETEATLLAINADALAARYAQCDETCTADCGHCKGRRFGPYALPTRYDAVLDSGPADDTATRYDAEWPDMIAAEAPDGGATHAGRSHVDLDGRKPDTWSSLPPVFAPRSFVGGDLAAMAAPLPGMARDDLGTYAEPVEVHIDADVSAFRDAMARAAGQVTVVPSKTFRKMQDSKPDPAPRLKALVEARRSRGRHRQTDPLDLILADLRDIEDRLS